MCNASSGAEAVPALAEQAGCHTAGCDDVGAPASVKRQRHNPRASGIPIIPLTVKAHVDNRKSFAELGVAVARNSRFHRMCCLEVSPLLAVGWKGVS